MEFFGGRFGVQRTRRGLRFFAGTRDGVAVDVGVGYSLLMARAETTDEGASLSLAVPPLGGHLTVAAPVLRAAARAAGLREPHCVGASVAGFEGPRGPFVQWSVGVPTRSRATPWAASWRDGCLDVLPALFGELSYERELVEELRVLVPLPEGSYPATATVEDLVWGMPRWPGEWARERMVTLTFPQGIDDGGGDAFYRWTWGTSDHRPNARPSDPDRPSVGEAIGSLVGEVLASRGGTTYRPTVRVRRTLRDVSDVGDGPDEPELIRWEVRDGLTGAWKFMGLDREVGPTLTAAGRAVLRARAVGHDAERALVRYEVEEPPCPRCFVPYGTRCDDEGATACGAISLRRGDRGAVAALYRAAAADPGAYEEPASLWAASEREALLAADADDAGRYGEAEALCRSAAGLAHDFAAGVTYRGPRSLSARAYANAMAAAVLLSAHGADSARATAWAAEFKASRRSWTAGERWTIEQAAERCRFAIGGA